MMRTLHAQQMPGWKTTNNIFSTLQSGETTVLLEKLQQVHISCRSQYWKWQQYGIHKLWLC